MKPAPPVTVYLAMPNAFPLLRDRRGAGHVCFRGGGWRRVPTSTAWANRSRLVGQRWRRRRAPSRLPRSGPVPKRKERARSLRAVS